MVVPLSHGFLKEPSHLAKNKKPFGRYQHFAEQLFCRLNVDEERWCW
jgi:hypothetical protein